MKPVPVQEGQLQSIVEVVEVVFGVVVDDYLVLRLVLKIILRVMICYEFCVYC